MYVVPDFSPDYRYKFPLIAARLSLRVFFVVRLRLRSSKKTNRSMIVFYSSDNDSSLRFGCFQSKFAKLKKCLRSLFGIGGFLLEIFFN